MNRALWIVQILLALLFLVAGAMKFVVPADQIAARTHLSGLFIHFIGVVEVLGAFGLILPWRLRIQPVLTPLAAAGLVVIMIGATEVTLSIGPAAPALFPFVTGILCAFVAWGRRRAVP